MSTKFQLLKSKKPAPWPYSLGDLAIFADCTPGELERIGSCLTMLAVEPGTTLINEGTIGLEFLVIASGTAVVSIGSVAVAELGRGDFVGEMSLLGRRRRSASVIADSNVVIYVANAAEFATLVEAAPSVAAKISAAATARAAANVSAGRAA